MAVSFRSVAASPPPRTVQLGRIIRKVALLGSHGASLKWCPWDDPSWEFWGHASARAWYQRQPDRYFDLHRRECWKARGKQDSYVKWLRTNTVPIYMQERDPEIPASRRYPKERILMEYGGARRYFTNHVAWMIALAFSEGVTHLGLFGIDYQNQSEYVTQRGSAEYWLGRVEERGVHLVLPEGCTLLTQPAGLYGYESHDENGVLLEPYRFKRFKPTETISTSNLGVPRAEPPGWLVPAIEAEEAMRPEWSLGPLPKRTDGGTV